MSKRDDRIGGEVFAGRTNAAHRSSWVSRSSRLGCWAIVERFTGNDGFNGGVFVSSGGVAFNAFGWDSFLMA